MPPRAIKHQLTCPFELTSGRFLIGRRGILVIPWNHLDVTGIVYKVEEFRAPISVMQCYNCQSFGHSAKTCRSKQTCLICGENHSHKGCPSRELRKPTCANCKGPHVASSKGCPEYRTDRRSDNMWLATKNHIPQY